MLRAGVIGLGVGQAHAATYAAHPGTTLAGVCDLRPEPIEHVRRVHPDTAVYASPDALLDDPEIDIVSIASYDDAHYEQIVHAITTGKHVFVEKPLCLYRHEAHHIRELLAEHPGVRLSSNLVLRTAPRFANLRGRIIRGELGELFSVEGDYNYGRLQKITDGWRGAIDFYSVVYGGAIHIVDLLMWLTGSRIVEVAAFGNRIASRGSQFRYNDAVVAALHFENGIIGKVGVSYGCMRPHFHGLKVYGTRASFVNGHPDATLYISRDPAAAPLRISDPYPARDKGALLTGFIDALLAGGEPPVSEVDVFETMSVCFAIEESVRMGRLRPVEYL